MCRCGACRVHSGDVGDQIAGFCEKNHAGAEDNRARKCREVCLQYAEETVEKDNVANCDAKQNYNCNHGKLLNSKLCVGIRRLMCGLKSAGTSFMSFFRELGGQGKAKKLMLDNCVKVCNKNGVQATRGLDWTGTEAGNSKSEGKLVPKTKPAAGASTSQVKSRTQ